MDKTEGSRARTLPRRTTLMTTVAAYAAPAAKAPLERTTIERREVGEFDVLIDIKFAGICHSDIHQAREGWGEAIFPMVPGHEIAGIVSEAGAGVTKYQVGDRMGVKIAPALGAEVTVLSQSLRKKDDGLKLGADHYYATSDEQTFKDLQGSFDLILSTVSAPLDFGAFLSLLKRDGALVNVGAPE